MSLRAWRAVLDHSRHEGDELLLLLVIADSIDRDTGEAFPSISYLARRARMGRRKIFKVLQRLRVGGELLVTSGKGGGCRQANRYSLNPSPSNSDTLRTNNSDTGGTNPERPNSAKSSIGIVPQRARNSADGGHTILSYPDQNPIRAVTDVQADSQKVSKPPKLKRPTQPKCEWPNHLLLTPEMREFAAKFGINPDTEFIAWHDDCLAHGRRYIDWTAAWRTRCRNAVKFGAGGASRPAPPLTARQMAEQGAARGREAT
jgi:hypothetical protein